MTRRGMTLVEMLVALAATLLLMTAIAQAFAVFGGAMSSSRSLLELDSRMRNAAWRLRSDLAGATARPVPPLGPDGGAGYLEIIEGPNTDVLAHDFYDPVTDTITNGSYFDRFQNDWVPGPFLKSGTVPGPGPNSDDRLLGDHDDVLLFTTRSTDAPFIGRAPTAGTTIALQTDLFESTLAEVAWFARPTQGMGNPVTYTLYRRQLLVMGYVGADPFSSGNTMQWADARGSWGNYFNLPCDVSVRREGGRLFPNALADLARRENRFLHNPGGITGLTNFPFFFASGNHQTIPPADGLIFSGPDGMDNDGDSLVDEADEVSQRQGEDVVLTNVLSFDVRVFDPGAPVVLTANNTALVPGDLDFNSTWLARGGAAASGAYVDLGYQDVVISASNSLLTAIVSSGSAAKFVGYGQAKSRLVGANIMPRTYDTWSLHYEADGLDEDGDGVPDEGTNGIDDDGDGSFDEPPYDADGDGVFEDPGETETLPPYPVPLRGIEIRIRCYEPTSRQVRQITVRHTFVPH